MEFLGPINSGEMVQGMGWASHIRLYPYDAKNMPMVTLFGSPNFDVGLARVFAPGSYNHEQVSYSTLYTMPVQSFIVPSGLTLVLFKDF